jgi:beta-mannosidase
MAWPDANLAGSGRMHDVHGPWRYEGPAGHYALYNAIDPLVHSEFGVEGAANLGTLKGFVSSEHRFPPDETNPVWVHRASWWLHRGMLESMFGRFDEIESFVRASQWMQAEGLRYAVESHRRRMGRCSMVLPWQFNEAFPNTACTSAVDYLGLTKPAYWRVRRAYEPVHISLKYDRVAWAPDEEWNGEVWISNEGAGHKNLRCETTAISIEGETMGSWTFPIAAPATRSTPVGALTISLPAAPCVFIVFLALFDVSGSPLSRNDYLFSTATPPFHPCRSASPARLLAKRDGDALLLGNAGKVPALFVALDEDPQTLARVPPMDNYFCLRPGERCRLDSVDESITRVSAWNCPEVQVSDSREQPASPS